MLKKTQNVSNKAEIDALKERLLAMKKDADEIAAQGTIAAGEVTPVEIDMPNLENQIEDTAFWLNFRKGAPIFFCAMMEGNPQIKQVRDMSFMETLLKVRSIMGLMQSKVESNDARVDVIQWSLACQALETRLNVLTALNTTIDGDSDERMTLNIQGTGKAIQIDLTKLKDAVKIIDKQLEAIRNQAANATKIEEIDITNISEQDFLAKAKELIGPIKKTERKTLTKECFIKIFKYSGDFAKLRGREIKSKAQEERMVHFGTDHKQYLATL